MTRMRKRQLTLPFDVIYQLCHGFLEVKYTFDVKLRHVIGYHCKVYLQEAITKPL